MNSSNRPPRPHRESRDDSTPPAAPKRPDGWRNLLSAPVRDLRQTLVSTRREIHRHPELGYEETRTAALVAGRLREMGIEVRERVGRTGVVGLLRGGQPGPVVLYRADMDALPIQEDAKKDYSSAVPGVMHACGHDGHTAIALGIAAILSKERETLRGTVKFVFQPAEEGGGGAAAMIRDGVLGEPAAEWAFGVHLDNDLPVGRIAISPGPVMAASGEFCVTVRGKGGHAAMPQVSRDPVVAAAHLVIALQTVVSRQVDPLEPAVVTIGMIHGGTRENVIPGEVTLRGTVRAFREDLQRDIVRRIEQMAKGTAEAFGVQCRFQWEDGYPATENDPEATQLVRGILRDLVGESALQPFRMMGSEDMSQFLRKVRGCYFMVGSRNDEKGLNAPHHSAQFDFDEDALLLGVEAGIRVLRKALGMEGVRAVDQKPAGTSEAAPREQAAAPVHHPAPVPEMPTRDHIAAPASRPAPPAEAAPARQEPARRRESAPPGSPSSALAASPRAIEGARDVTAPRPAAETPPEPRPPEPPRPAASVAAPVPAPAPRGAPEERPVEATPLRERREGPSAEPLVVVTEPWGTVGDHPEAEPSGKAPAPSPEPPQTPDSNGDRQDEPPQKPSAARPWLWGRRRRR